MDNEYSILISSNSNPALNIEKVKNIIFEQFIVIGFSDIIESEAVCGGKGNYLNAVVILVSEIGPDEMVVFLKEIETILGRIRGPESNGQVAIDLDLVEQNGQVLREKDAKQDYYKNCIKTISISI